VTRAMRERRAQWLRASELGPGELGWLDDALAGDRFWYDFYHRCALDALADGQDNRLYWIAESGAGLILGIEFSGIDVFTLIGELAPREVDQLALRARPAEIHASVGHLPPLLEAAGARVRKQTMLAYYRRRTAAGEAWPLDPDCRRATAADLETLQRFYAAHYPDTVLSAWMLDHPFVGLWQGGELVAAAGTLVVHRGLAACHVGNFLTHPGARGRGLAGRVAQHLFELLRREGIGAFMLGVQTSNLSAVRLYERLGFARIDERSFLLLAGAGSAVEAP
jgi:ribosomal protein S18 acetylase RimI-like enzyme